MENITKTFPMGVGGLGRSTTPDYTVVDVSGWHDQLLYQEQEMLEWLQNHNHPSWFAWERPRGTMIFQDHRMAMMFVLKWFLWYTLSQQKMSARNEVYNNR